MKHRPVRISLLFLVTLLLGFTQGITLVLLIPLLGLLTPEAGLTGRANWVPVLNAILDRIGMGLSLELVLAVFALCLLSVAVLTALQSVWQATCRRILFLSTERFVKT